MITKMPTEPDFLRWKTIFDRHQNSLSPNNKSGNEIRSYLQKNYTLTEIHDKDALDVVSQNVLMNAFYADKLPFPKTVKPCAFYVENRGKAAKFYEPENTDSSAVWGGNVSKIFVGIELISGFYTVEGSCMLWDELCAFRGLDEQDIKNIFFVQI